MSLRFPNPPPLPPPPPSPTKMYNHNEKRSWIKQQQHQQQQNGNGKGKNKWNQKSSQGSSYSGGMDQASYGDGTLQPLGLENLGNTCFMNSALQCLSRTKLLIPKLEQFGSGHLITVRVAQQDGQATITVLDPSPSKRKGEGDATETDLEIEPACGEENFKDKFLINLHISPESMTARLKHAFSAITRQAENKTSESSDSYSYRDFKPPTPRSNLSFRPNDVHNMIAKNFRPGAQHDSHELLRTIIDMMKKDQTKAFRAAIMNKFGVAKRGEGSDPKMVELVKSLDKKTKHQTFVDEIFGGVLMTTQTCLTCNSIKRSHEAFLDLSLPIRVSKESQTQKPNKTTNSSYYDYPDNDNIVVNRTVDECLSAFTEPELLTGSNVVECENCHRVNLEKVENGTPYEEVFPECKQNIPAPSSPSSSNADGGGKLTQKGTKNKKQEDRKKRRPSRQNRLKNQISRQEHELKENSEFAESDSFASTQTSSISIIENHFTSKEPSEDASSKSTLDDYVVVTHSDVLESVNLAKRKFMDAEAMDDCDDDLDILPLISDSETDHEPSAAPSQETLPDMATASLKCEGDFDGDADGDSDFPSAADGIGGSASDGEEDNGVPPLDLDLPAYNKFNCFHVPCEELEGVPEVTTMDLFTEKPAADEGYSEGDNSGENDSAAAVGGSYVPPMQPLSLSQGSSSRNSISDPDESSKGGSGNETEKILKKKEPPVTKCPCSRQQAISRPPEFLTIHLKRFQISNRGFTSKLNDHVEFPLLLDITKFCSGVSEDAQNEIFDEDNSVVYSLYGIVEHSGNLHWGHYVAYFRVQAEDGQVNKDKWYYVSDTYVNDSSAHTVAGTDPYILFYERVRGSEKKEREQIKKETEKIAAQKKANANAVNTSRYPVIDTWGEHVPQQSDEPISESQGNGYEKENTPVVDGDICNPGNIFVIPPVEEYLGDDAEKGNVTNGLTRSPSTTTNVVPPIVSYWYTNSPDTTEMLPASNYSWENNKEPKPSSAWESEGGDTCSPSRPQNSEGEEEQQQSEFPVAVAVSTINYIDDSSEEL